MENVFGRSLSSRSEAEPLLIALRVLVSKMSASGSFLRWMKERRREKSWEGAAGASSSSRKTKATDSGGDACTIRCRSENRTIYVWSVPNTWWSYYSFVQNSNFDNDHRRGMRVSTEWLVHIRELIQRLRQKLQGHHHAHASCKIFVLRTTSSLRSTIALSIIGCCYLTTIWIPNDISDP